jgi:hypothetical protein
MYDRSVFDHGAYETAQCPGNLEQELSIFIVGDFARRPRPRSLVLHQVLTQPCESSSPLIVKLIEPLANVLEPFWMKTVVVLPADSLLAHQAQVEQEPEVLRHRWAGNGHATRQVAHSLRSRRKLADQSPSEGMGYRPESVIDLRGTCRTHSDRV